MRRTSIVLALVLAWCASLAPVARADEPTPPPPSPSGVRGAVEDVLAELERLRPGGRSFTGKRSERVQDAAEVLKQRRDRLARRVKSWVSTYHQIQMDLTNAHLRLDGARKELAAARVDLRNDTRTMFMTGAWQPVVAVMHAGDLEDAGRVAVYMQSVLGKDIDSVRHFRDLDRRYTRTFEIVEKRAADLLDLQRNIEREGRRLRDLETSLRELVDEVVQTFGTGSRSFTALINRAQRGQSAAANVMRVIRRPAKGRVSSPFGIRTHPIYGYRSLHTGIDIATAAATRIVAPADGVVIASGMAGPFGLATIIDHGSRLATVIAHQSTSVVRAGDHVRAGDEIGSVGCTGWCTGPHVHLELWLDGKPVDPAPWLRGGA